MLLHHLLLLAALLCPAGPWVSGADTSPAARCTVVTAVRNYQRCMTLPTQQASLAWTYHPQNATLDLAFSGTFISPSGWVAWGINPASPEMTGTRALVAFADPATGALVVLPYVLDPAVKLQRAPLASRSLDIPLLTSSAVLHRGGGGTGAVREGAAVEIHATLRLVPNRTRVHHVWNRGLYVQGYSPTIHPTAAADLASRATVDVLSSAATPVGSAPPESLRTAHAVLNALSWGFLLPVGMAVARYLRQCERAGPSWFYAHAAVQIAGFTLGTAGFALGLLLGSASPGVVYPLHRKLGVAAFCMGAVQMLALFFRPKATHKFRKYWKSYHHFVGYACVVVAVVNVFQGFDVMGLGRSYAKLGYCLALSSLLGACMALEVNAWVVFCRKAEEEKMRREGAPEGHSGPKSTFSG